MTIDHWETGYYEGDEWTEEPDFEPDESYDFDEDAGYYGDEPWPENVNDTSTTLAPHELAEENDMAFASYTDARKRFQELKMSRGYLPIVALTDPQHGGQAPTSPTTSPSNWRASGKEKGNSKSGKYPSPNPRLPFAILLKELDTLIPREEPRQT